MEALTPRQEQAIAALKNRLRAIQGIEEIRDGVFEIMVVDWINNVDPNEPGFENEQQLIDLVKEDYPNFDFGNQEASEVLTAWNDFVAAFYAVDPVPNAPNNAEMNGGKHKKRSKKTRKHKKQSKKTRKQSKKTRKH